MTEYTARDHAALMARARAALETPADLDEAAVQALIEDIAVAEDRLALGPVPWAFEVHVGVIEHTKGMNTYAATTRAGLDSEMAEFCREWWHEISDPRDPASMKDEAVIDAYFEEHEREFVTTNRIQIDAPKLPKAA